MVDAVETADEIVGATDSAAVRLDEPLANAQPQAEPRFLAADKRFKEAFLNPRRDAGTAILNAHFDH